MRRKALGLEQQRGPEFMKRGGDGQPRAKIQLPSKEAKLCIFLSSLIVQFAFAIDA